MWDREWLKSAPLVLEYYFNGLLLFCAYTMGQLFRYLTWATAIVSIRGISTFSHQCTVCYKSFFKEISSRMMHAYSHLSLYFIIPGLRWIGADSVTAPMDTTNRKPKKYNQHEIMPPLTWKAEIMEFTHICHSMPQLSRLVNTSWQSMHKFLFPFSSSIDINTKFTRAHHRVAHAYHTETIHENSYDLPPPHAEH